MKTFILIMTFLAWNQADGARVLQDEVVSVQSPIHAALVVHDKEGLPWQSGATVTGWKLYEYVDGNLVEVSIPKITIIDYGDAISDQSLTSGTFIREVRTESCPQNNWFTPLGNTITY